MTLSETAHAKINLALHVRRRRPDGYHDLETIFAFTELGDVLTAEPADTLSLAVDGPFAADVPTGEDNLILRAAQALVAAATPDAAHPERSRGTHVFGAVRPSTSLGMSGAGANSDSYGAALRLTKNLPVASGIGGGSADAAAALRLLNRLWGARRSLDALAALGAPLGADIPACVYSQSLFGRGKGDALVPVETGTAGAPVLLVNPGVAVSTAAVFKAWDGIDRGPLGDAAAGRNDLEAPARALAPEIDAVLAALKAQPGTTLVRMSGSGATCFALFESSEACEAASAALARPGWWVARSTLL